MPPAQNDYVFFYFYIVYTCFISSGGRLSTCAQRENFSDGCSINRRFTCLAD